MPETPPPLVQPAELALATCSRPVGGMPCEVCLPRAERTLKNLAAVGMAVIRAELSPTMTPQTAPQPTETGTNGVLREIGSTDDGIFLEAPTAPVETQRVRAVVHNAIDRALSTRGHWVPLRVRIGIAETVLASLAIYGYRLVYDEVGDGSALRPVQEALESTETDEQPESGKVGSPDLSDAPEGGTALRERYIEGLAFESTAWGRHRPPWLLRDTIEKIADAVLAVRDDELADALRRTERAEEIVRVVSATTTQWAAMAPPDDWGLTPADTVLADAGRIILALIGPQAALDVPADGEQAGGDRA